jgi:hypothetical protein
VIIETYPLEVMPVSSTGSLNTVSGELAKCKLDLVEGQEVRWDKCGTEPAGDYTFFYGNGNADHHLGTDFFVHKRIISAVKERIARTLGGIYYFTYL